MEITTNSPNFLNATLRNWFDNMVATLRAHELSLETNIASENTRTFFEELASADETHLAAMARNSSSLFFIKRLVVDFIKEIREAAVEPSKLALDFSNSEVLVWAEIREDDEVTEDALLIAKAKVNAKYYPHGFYISSMIVEDVDEIPVPPHYQVIIGEQEQEKA